MRSEPSPDDAGTAAVDDEPWYELAFALLGTFAGFVAGVALGWYAITWGVDTLRDVMDVPELSPVPVADRAPGVPGPTAGYWVAWAIPPLLVYAIGVAVVWRSRAARWFTVSLLLGFTGLCLMLVPLWISMDVGGFSPS